MRISIQMQCHCTFVTFIVRTVYSKKLGIQGFDSARVLVVKTVFLDVIMVLCVL